MDLSSCLTITLLLMTSFLAMTSATQKHVGRVRLYVDKAGMDKWQRITGKPQSSFREEMDSTFFEINQVLKTLEPNGVSIQLQIENVHILNDNFLNVDSQGKIPDRQSVIEFKKYVEPNYPQNKYDLAILFTGYNLATSSTDDNVAGYAFIASICSSEALAVLELRAIYMDVLMASHEIGHIFGAEHDGTAKAKDCNKESGEILNPLVSIWSPKHFTYSACSARQIKAKLDQLTKDNNNCLATWSTNDDITGPRYGSLMSPDKLCQRRFGPTTSVARKAYSSYGDSMCTQLACLTKTEGTYFHWNYTVTPPGINCGKNKQCIQGRCVGTASGSAQVSDHYPFGDQPKIEGDYQMTCNDVTSSMCQWWNNTCCQTCHDPGSADDVCRHLVGKDSSMARRAYSSYGDKFCSKLACLTGVTDNFFHWKEFPAPDGLKCGKNKRCRNMKCVSTKAGDPKVSDTCPFGDQPWLAGRWKMTCADYVRQNGCSAPWFKEICCGSCTDPGTPDEACKRFEGPNAAMARYYYKTYGDNLCAKLACLTSVKGWNFYWQYHPTPDGMKCGKKKRCINGKCLLSATGDPTMQDACPYGDQPWLSGNYNSNCPVFVNKNGCTWIGMYQICCKSCPQ